MHIAIIPLLSLFIQVYTQETVKVSLYYEALCPFSQEFINEQLYPGYQTLGDVLTLELIPFGKAKVKSKDGKVLITCQHGPKECIANKVQACVLGQSYTQEESINFVGCIMATGEPEAKENAKKCARTYKLPWKSIKSCITGEKGKDLLIHFGNITANLKPKLEYVPHIIFDDLFDKDDEDNARKNFLKTVCQKFQSKPEGC